MCIRDRLHRVEAGINSRASRMPNCAEEIVAPVVGDTNLLLHSCCIDVYKRQGLSMSSARVVFNT